MNVKTVIYKPPIDPLIIGIIGAAYGINGWLKLFSCTQEIEKIFNYQPWFIKLLDTWQSIQLENWKHYKSSFIFKIKDINDRSAALKLINCKIFTETAQLHPLKEGDYYWKDLIHCKVINLQGYQLGKVIDLLATGSNDVLIVKADLRDSSNVQTRLIPFIDNSVIKKVNLIMKIIEVDWQPDF